MPTLFSIVLFTHIGLGTLSIASGLILLTIKKGNQLHRRLGRLFSASLLSGGSLALTLSIMHPNLFLGLVSLFTLYMVGMGHRYAQRKDKAPNLLDRCMAQAILLTGLVLILLALPLLFQGNQMGLVPAAFGGLGLMYAVQDGKALRQNPLPNPKRLQLHLQRMLGALIASLSAFLVVNYRWFPEQFPSPILWLFPTFVLAPIIVIWSKRVERGQGPAKIRNHEKANEL
jgi:uncharacterized membrane protein